MSGNAGATLTSKEKLEIAKKLSQLGEEPQQVVRRQQAPGSAGRVCMTCGDPGSGMAATLESLFASSWVEGSK